MLSRLIVVGSALMAVAASAGLPPLCAQEEQDGDVQNAQQPPAHDGEETQQQEAAPAQQTTASQQPRSSEQEPPDDLFEILLASGVIGAIIVLLSVIAGGLVIEHLFTIRRGTLIPYGLADDVHQLIAQSQFAQAQQRCKETPSFLAYVLQSGLLEVRQGYAAVEKAMEDAAQEQAARLFRKIEYLSVIGTIAPMLGLLGTVVGLIMAFQEVAATQGMARAADLAEGIYLALVTTVEGLVVAIPALAAFAIFRNRVDQLVAEATLLAEHVFAGLKRQRNRAQGSGIGGQPSQGRA